MTALRGAGTALSIALLTATPRADAALGEPDTSIRADRVALRASDRGTTVRQGYSVQELRVGSTLIREYVGPSGLVFGVAWNGLSHPDLAPLLGKYAGEYREARRKTSAHAGRRHQRLATDHLVVETWGHMRNLQGRAYVPSLLPPGVVPDDLS